MDTPAPGTVVADPKRPYKAYVATAVSFVVIFLGMWIQDDDPFTKKEAAASLISALMGSGLTGGMTYRVRNPKVIKS